MAELDSTRIARLYRRDCVVASLALLALWLAIAFILAEVWSMARDGSVRSALVGGAAVLLLLNTASIIALIRHYTADKIHLYGLDIFYIDAMRAEKRGARDVR